MNTSLKAKLALVAPSIAFTTSREVDESFRWDGDGPDPVIDGYYPYDVTVTASAIVNGELLEGNDYLGGSYYTPEEPTGDVHGYLIQMLDGALDALAYAATVDFPYELKIQIRDAKELLKQESQASYDAQRTELETA